MATAEQGRWGNFALPRLMRRPASWRWRLTLVQRFAVACLVVLVAGAFIIGTWVAREIESGVIRRTAAITALYVDSFVSPHLEGLSTSSGLDEESMESLAALLDDTPLGQKIVSFKVWSPGGQVLFATYADQIGRRYAISPGLGSALEGRVYSRLSDLEEEESRLEQEDWSRLVETYSPVLSRNGVIVGAVEFYQRPDDLLAEVQSSQRRGWAIVGTSTVVMYLLLVGLVAGASRTIARQQRSLELAVDEQTRLQSRIHALNQRLRRAAGAKVETDEQMLRRLSQDLHDGPAQDLALALLRISSVRSEPASEEEREALAVVELALRRSLDGVRSLTTALRLPELEGLSWAETATQAVADHHQRTGVAIHLAAGEVRVQPSPAQRIALYRVIQEALSNASLHSGTEEHHVTLSEGDHCCTLRIEDRGAGIVGDAAAQTGRRARLGLRGMRERVEVLGGTFVVSSSPGQGTTVAATFPFAGDDHVS